MPKVALNNLVPGMKLAKPVTNDRGMVLLAEGTELSGPLIERLGSMNVVSVYIDSAPAALKAKGEMLAELDARFRKTEGEPFMGLLKRLFADRIENPDNQ